MAKGRLKSDRAIRSGFRKSLKDHAANPGASEGVEAQKSDADLVSALMTERVAAVMRGAAEEGLTLAKDGRIAGRVSAELIAAAKARTGLQSDTDLVEFALANVALEDGFAQVFRDVKGTVDPDLDLRF